MDGGALEAGVRRVIVLGGLGWFGRAIAEQLGRLGVGAISASRGAGAPLRIDANDPASLHSNLRPGDIVIDAAGPYHLRSTAFVEAAIEIGFDVIDLNDYLHYAHALLGLKPQIDAAGIRVLTSASTVSAVAAAVVRRVEIASPVSIRGFIVPASKHSANPGAALSLLRSVGRPISVWRAGRLQTAIGWSESRGFPMPQPVGRMFVDTNTPGVNWLFCAAARSVFVRQILERRSRTGTQIARWLGSPAGGVGYEIEGSDGRVARFAIVAGQNGFLTAIAPAILAARRLAENRFDCRGLVSPDRHVEPQELFEFLAETGIKTVQLE
jgi:hypothetical protein